MEQRLNSDICKFIKDVVKGLIESIPNIEEDSSLSLKIENIKLHSEDELDVIGINIIFSKEQGISPNCLYHYWYGGRMVDIGIIKNGEELIHGYISAEGEINATLNDINGEEIMSVRDKSARGGFYDFKKNGYINNDEELNRHISDNNNLLTFENNNWWELYIHDKVNTYVLSDYSLLDGIVEAINILIQQINKGE